MQSKEQGYEKKMGYLCLNNRAGVGHFRIERIRNFIVRSEENTANV
jgi:hypothetical protein